MPPWLDGAPRAGLGPAPPPTGATKLGAARRLLSAGRARGHDWDLRCARSLHHGVRSVPLQRLMLISSRLADGPLWLLVLAALPMVGGAAAWPVVAVAASLGAVNLALYWAVKHGTRRERPFRRCDDIRAGLEPADLFSFPSGHTLHAVSFAVLLAGQYPALAALVWTFALLVATSRVVLGVHYPSDVVAGAAIGAATAHLALRWL